ncbi:hypothetical protein A2966_01145 [Candidatus Roizmanbacteria bacterium RIFCSPLOWO2_01_FULL_41_22]|uniref:Methylated-DNA-[protein]-cysteine S-methyltransferase DNA binding domain-containing protein n=2 Tax=Candidatus Roizmaniibacteriota TaxID=1752723 RepID=A0A1F7JR37_9BACT|nr:MAG: hypothetical protein A2966_01145 [Candidatus Roizmanbacteria bacterium RIFCSPLOWO2_01_FULL_41_22]OGK58066.1 MAG: hypothetical protein A3H86_03260 [Candidatus Roizmanbacteria bacterium RIFCSPLOWO2_02_FULL_41_9]
MTLQEKVYQVVGQVPKGKVTTYGDIGLLIGSKAYRQIGQILHKNKNSQKVPCHRVVFKDGSLSENFGMGGREKQRDKLQTEGVTFINGKVDLAKHLNLVS